MRLGKPGVLQVQGGAVAPPGRLQRLVPEDDPPLLDIPVGVGGIAVLSASKDLFLHVGEICPGRGEQGPVLPPKPHKALAAPHLSPANPGRRRLDGRGCQIFCGHHRREKGVAHHVPHMGPGVAQHGQIPPRVPLVHESGGHLPPDVPVQLLYGLVPGLLGPGR